MSRLAMFVWLGLASQLSGCDSSVGQARCVYSARQIAELETRASAKDRHALRELDICYGFDGREADQQRIHKVRRQLQDPDLLKEDAMSLISLAENESDVVKRRALLVEALKLANQAAINEGNRDPSQDAVVQAVTKAVEQSLQN